MEPASDRRPGTHAAIIALFAAAYFVAGKLGLQLAFVHEHTTAVWPPAGIALAGLLLWGYRLWPGVLLGALVVNLTIGDLTLSRVAASIGIAMGNTLEALVGAYLVNRFANGFRAFHRAKNVFAFAALAAFVSTTVSATIGVASLCLAGLAPWAGASAIWFTWWIGDAGGDLILAPVVILGAMEGHVSWRRGRIVEALLLALGLMVLCLSVFTNVLPPRPAHLGMAILCVPPLFWAVFRFGQLAAAVAVLLQFCAAVWGALHGMLSGALAPPDVLLEVQVYLGITSVMVLAVAAEVSQRRRNQEELEVVTEHMATAVTRCSRDLRYVWVSREYASWLGRSREEIGGRPIVDILGPEAYHTMLPHIERVLSGEKVRYEAEIRFRGPGTRWIHAVYVPTRRGNDEADGWIAVVSDITESKQAARRLEANLAISEILAESPALSEATPRILRTIGETLNWEVGCLWTRDSHENFLRCAAIWRDPSVKAERFESASRAQTFAPGKGLPGRVWSTRKAAWIPDVSRDDNFPRGPVAASEGLHAAFGFPILLGEKFLGVMEFFSRQIRSPDSEQLMMFGGIGNQIGQFIERKRAEEELRESEERLRFALSGARAVAWDWNLLTGQSIRSESAAEIFGVSTGAAEEFLSLIHPDDRPIMEEAIRKAIHEEGSYDIEFRMVKPDGQVRWVADKARVRYAPDGKAEHVAGVCSDITERKTMEEDRARLLNRERAARAEAERSNRLKDEFLATVSHELRTPLTAVLGWVRMLRSGDLDPASWERALEVVERNAAAQAKLIDEILDVSRTVSGNLRLHLRPIELRPVLEAAIATVEPAAAAKDIRIERWMEPQPGKVMGDPDRLQQVVSNLLSNAVKFTPPGGSASVRLERTESQVEITVSDTGKGIRAEFLPHAFEPFRQADGSASRMQGGLGLGLAIVRRLVELHGGTVWATSEGEGRGAIFTIRLPLATGVEQPEDRPEVDASVAAAEDTVLRGLRVLVVEDDNDTRDFLTALLKNTGAIVTAVASAREAAGAIRTADVLVCDIGLPGEDGYSFIRRIRALTFEECGNIPAIALTAYARAEDRVQALAAGFQVHLTKPVDAASLVRSIQALAGGVRDVASPRD